MEDSKNLKGFVDIFNCEKKSELKKLCKKENLYGTDFANLILASELAQLPYLHKIHHREYIPEELQLNAADYAEMGKAKVGELEGAAKKAFGKVSAIFDQRSILIGHLFYTPDHEKWHLFYFDQRDTVEENNHWKQGAHAHLINYLWPNWSAQTIWHQFVAGGEKLNGSLHFKFQVRDYAKGKNGTELFIVMAQDRKRSNQPNAL